MDTVASIPQELIALQVKCMFVLWVALKMVGRKYTALPIAIVIGMAAGRGMFYMQRAGWAVPSNGDFSTVILWVLLMASALLTVVGGVYVLVRAVQWLWKQARRCL